MDPTAETPETLPPAIVDRLRRLDRSQPIVDPRADRAVLEAARAYFAARPARSARRRWAMPLAAAATLLLAAILVRPLVFDAVPARDDVDGSGRVDILDVLALARVRAERGDAAGVTQVSIDELAYRIVALESPRRQP
jgi:hypothetical protein